MRVLLQRTTDTAYAVDTGLVFRVRRLVEEDALLPLPQTREVDPLITSPAHARGDEIAVARETKATHRLLRLARVLVAPAPRPPRPPRPAGFAVRVDAVLAEQIPPYRVPFVVPKRSKQRAM